MKIGIVGKLFLLTTLLCMLILAMMFVGQTVFFKQYYVNQKTNDILTSIQSFEKAYLNTEEEVSVKKLEQEFYQENNTWITTLDNAGNIKYANDFSVKVHLDLNQHLEFTNRVMNIPLYTIVDLEEIQRVKYFLQPGNRIFIDGIRINDTVIPAILSVENRGILLENMLLSEKIYGQSDVRELTPKASPKIFLTGIIEEVNLPMGSTGSSFYSNSIFMERIKHFQANLLLKQEALSSSVIMDYEENNVPYKIFIRPLEDTSGETTYIFAMTSLQPVDEAVQMLEDYYVYFILVVLALILLASFYYSKKIAKPLLQINYTTKKMANLDFSESIPITSKDEIGTLSQNINTLSMTLHSYINKLQQDIEKEKQLENTRKEFIAGVSHELKTPLSIMKSCISILQDGVATDKTDYYFKAMAKEVDKMNMLIVDMLELAKYESGTYKMKMDVFYIDEIIEYICGQLDLEIRNKQIQIHKQLTKVKVVANQHRIEQVLTNFITNAIRHTPENKKIIVSAVEDDERVKVCVENNGAPIPEAQLEKIWERFYRGDASRNRSKGGTGLGLAIAKNILELHGAEYGVTNLEDGVKFYFYLNKQQ